MCVVIFLFGSRKIKLCVTSFQMYEKRGWNNHLFAYDMKENSWIALPIVVSFEYSTSNS